MGAWRARFIKKEWLFRIINLILISLLAYASANATWQWLLERQEPTGSTRARPEPTPAMAAMPAKTAPADAAPFYGLFGTNSNAKPTKPSSSITPTNRPNLNLLGILHVEGHPESTRALIATPDRKERTYATGDTVGDAILRTIESGQVILEFQGQQEILRLPRQELPVQQAQQQDGGAGEGRVPVTPEARIAINQLWNAFQDKPESLLELVRLEPAYLNGKFAGMRIHPGKESTLLKRLGLEAGDRITRVNGVEWNEPLQGLTLLGSLGTAKTLQFQVQRGTDLLLFEWPRPP
ncbi:MAG: hypothetical protein HQM02_06310 [Magnetococcales bacterium]|nr:hypothetical protein [Magnetococcales bacterium]